MALSVSATPVGGYTLLAAVGEIDLQTAPDLRAALDQALADGATTIALDLDGVDFLDSSALGVLVGANKRMGQDTPLWIVCSRPHLLRLFEITKLTQAFTIVGSTDEVRA